jgi:hypothetical protein
MQIIEKMPEKTFQTMAEVMKAYGEAEKMQRAA